MTLEEMQAHIDALQRALDERKAQAPRHSPTKRIGDLEWEQEVHRNVTREDAQAIAQARGDGFRLPTILELLSVVDYDRNDPACSALPDMPPSQVWSSTVLRGNANRSWVVSFGGGSVHGVEKDRLCSVRLVRRVSATKPTQSSLFGAVS